ncbi:MacB-like periplasmic core domain protein [Candidatus Tiddalikarchaeum anstoanum]|nr:MacB-like periplasmic core domain protein [Candidatus Tiddalikarchaeum anstoanum]
MIGLSAANLKRNLSRTFLTTIGITIGIAAIISLVSISDGVRVTANNILGKMQYIMLLDKNALDDTMSHIPISLADRIGRFNGVGAFTESISFTVSSFNGQSIGVSNFRSGSATIVAGIGIQPEKAEEFKDTIFWYSVSRGRMLMHGEDNSILLSDQLAKDNNLFVGSVVEVNGRNYRVVGIFNLEKSLSSFTGMLVMTLDRARELTNYSTDEIGFINIIPADRTKTEELIQRLEDSYPQLRVTTSQQATEMLGGFLGSLTAALWIVSGIAAVVGGIGVMNTMLMSVMERIQEFGVLKAIGWKNNHIISMVMWEAILIGLMGGLSGVVLGYVGSLTVEWVSSIPTFVTPALIIEVLFFAISIGVVSAIYPALIAASMSPVEAVTYE